MILPRILVAILAMTFVGAASAQISLSNLVQVNLAPSQAPVGCDVLVNISNDSNNTFLIGSIGPIEVFDSNNVQVFFFQAFILVAIPVAPGAVHTYFRWDQRDNNGVQVAPGNYTMRVGLNGSTSVHQLRIGGVDAAVGSIGVHRPGTSRHLYLCSPQDPGATYVLAASFSTNNGIPTCAGLFPLDNDVLFQFSTMPGNGIFFNTIGSLAPLGAPFPGTTRDPFISIPPLLPAANFSFHVAFVVLQPAIPCPIARISASTEITVQ